MSLLADVQVDPRGSGRGMTHTAHQLRQRSACFGRECVTCMAKIMNVNLRRKPGLSECLRPGLGEVTTPELTALHTHEHETVWTSSGVQLQVRPQVRDDQLGKDDRPPVTGPNSGSLRGPAFRCSARHRRTGSSLMLTMGISPKVGFRCSLSSSS